MKKLHKNIIEALEYKENNPTVSDAEISKIFKIDRHLLGKGKKQKSNYKDFIYTNKSDSTDPYRYYFTPEELNVLNYYHTHKNIPYNKLINECPNVPGKRETLYHWLNIFGYEIYDTSIKYHYNRNKFNKIITEEDAYWLGFITADGCVVENRWLQIALAEKDRDHLIKFCKYMEFPDEEIEQIIYSSYGGSYTKDNPISGIKICSLEIIDNLKDKGITPKKSGKEKPYICNSLELQKAYIRGIIDGDGYIRSTEYGMGVVGSYEICSYIRQFIIDNIHDISKNNIHEHGIIWKFAFSGYNNTSIVLKALYENANIYLERKYKLYKTLYCRD